MTARNTIVINGKVYDAITGLAVAAPTTSAKTSGSETAPLAPETVLKVVEHEAARVAAGKAKSMHRHTQRSQTLRRDILKQPVAKHASATRKRDTGHIARSDMITKFAPHPKAIHAPKSADIVRPKATPDVPHVPHPIATAALKRIQDNKPVHPTTRPAALSSRELKQQLIAERLAAAQPSSADARHKAPRRAWLARAPRVSSVIAASLAIVFLGGYLTYISMPNLSMRVAASRAGVDASFPDYKPDGYHFDGPIAYNSGEVSVRFASNSNDSGYTVQQQNSSWDSQAVLDNYVAKKGKNYLTYSEQGLTIYTYDNNAAWVNGGIFYTVEGDAPLSTEQILHIASSM